MREIAKSKCSVLFLGKSSDKHCQKALEFCQENFITVSAYLGKWGDRLPEEVRRWKGDYIVSYLSRWIVPSSVLESAQVAAINFHPASPEYPGIGCNNFALYENARTYGVTCHTMASKVDTGQIIAVTRFPVLPEDDVRSLLLRTYDHQLSLFQDIVKTILAGNKLPVSSEKWARKPFTREEFNELSKITPEMSAEEVARRIRATSFGVWQPTVEIAGYSFMYRPKDDR